MITTKWDDIEDKEITSKRNDADFSSTTTPPLLSRQNFTFVLCFEEKKTDPNRKIEGPGVPWGGSGRGVSGEIPYVYGFFLGGPE